jgi:hypothetical protein
MDRPALRQLLADIEAGKVNCVVVYKVDRLSRSVMDFARMLEVFERNQVAFVSVTQQFNTTNSMGRLMLNVLLSFAQFERELISERTRDKIAAARRKGKWSGGMPLLGYDIEPPGGKLRINKVEANRVRAIYDLYLERESIMATIAELDIGLGLLDCMAHDDGAISNQGEDDARPTTFTPSTELGRSRHRNRPLDHAIRVRSQRSQEDPRRSDSNCNRSKTLETMGIE